MICERRGSLLDRTSFWWICKEEHRYWFDPVCIGQYNKMAYFTV